MKVIQSIMGHADITTTMDIYAEATEEKKQEIIANLENKICIALLCLNQCGVISPEISLTPEACA